MKRILYGLLACVSGLAAACGVEVEGPDPPLNTLYSPVGIALHPSGDYLYAVNSNFDVNYREDRGGTVVVINTDNFEIDPVGTVQIGTFGGDIKLNSPTDGSSPTRAYIAVRGSRSITALDILGEADGVAEGSRLRCKGLTLSAPCELPTSSDDPFGLEVSTFTADVGGTDAQVDFVAVAHLLGGDITGFTIKGDKGSGLSEAALNSFSATLVSGANAISLSPRTGHFYATSRFSGEVVAFRPIFDLDANISALLETGNVSIENASPYNGLDSRSIAFNSAGTAAYVANRGPDSLLFIDVGPSNVDTNTGTRNRVVDLIPLPQDPANLTVIEFDERELIYVTSYQDSAILVVDPRTHAIIDTITIPSEPYNMVVDQVKFQRLYVSLFADNAIAIIDIDPASPSFNQVTSVIR